MIAEGRHPGVGTAKEGKRWDEGVLGYIAAPWVEMRSRHLALSQAVHQGGDSLDD